MPALRFELVGEPGKVRIEWRGQSRHSGRDLLGQDDDGPQGQREEARAFLEEKLANGPVPTREINAEAKIDGISSRTLDRPRAELGVRHRREGGRTVLYLPNAPGEGADPQV